MIRNSVVRLREGSSMRVHRGQTRIVFEFERAGIVLKCPRTFFYMVRGVIRQYPRDPRLVRPIILKYIRWYVLDSYLANLREWWFWVRERHPFCQPTPLSLFGFVNIQRRGAVLPFEETDHARRMGPLVWSAGRSTFHTLLNPSNFCTVGGKLRILDYGTPEVMKFVRQHGRTMQEGYDLTV